MCVSVFTTCQPVWFIWGKCDYSGYQWATLSFPLMTEKSFFPSVSALSPSLSPFSPEALFPLLQKRGFLVNSACSNFTLLIVRRDKQVFSIVDEGGWWERERGASGFALLLSSYMVEGNNRAMFSCPLKPTGSPLKLQRPFSMALSNTRGFWVTAKYKRKRGNRLGKAYCQRAILWTRQATVPPTWNMRRACVPHSHMLSWFSCNTTVTYLFRTIVYCSLSCVVGLTHFKVIQVFHTVII